MTQSLTQTWRTVLLPTLFAAASIAQMEASLNASEPSGPALRAPAAVNRDSRQKQASPTDAMTEAAPLLEGPELSEKPSWTEVLRAVLLTAIPDKYRDLKHWGKTTRVVRGLDVDQHGLDLRISKRTKLVNHGSWSMYQVQLLNPQHHLLLALDNFQAHGVGKTSFDLHVTAKLRCTGRFEQWVLGVKGLNFSVVSDAVVQMDAQCEVIVTTEHRKKSFLPDLILNPTIKRVRLRLRDIDTHHVGQIRGDLAEEMGDGSKQFIADLMHRQEPKVTRKANAAIAKKRDALRIPASKLW